MTWQCHIVCCCLNTATVNVQVVVLTQRSKIEMESMFWRGLPALKRYGTQIIFRQGSPLVPTDLKMVGASKAAATVIVSDQSRNATEADAQSVRCAYGMLALKQQLGRVPVAGRGTVVCTSSMAAAK